MTQLPSAVCFSGKSLSIIDRDGVPHLSARDLAHALGYKDTVSLTHIHRCGTVASKEPRNSIAASGYRIRQSRGFFVPVRFHGGRVTDKKPRKGEEVRLSGCRFLASRLLRVRRLETSPRGHLDQPGDVL
ncbi:phage antirepressor protein [Xylella fastidiosa]|jgi:hypothetical protein|uniref:phage antirepressor protein n=1 Tax=Xylella fastidiosa TaxID=2371 RepID=UPI0009189220|nr:phage antirepressor protein [Xylella fastidiosa]NMR01509.1 phage antirepressor protein [Xylella fastidiosa]NMR46238.1 phage antirepressor protein [Xylella fastidiosa]QIS26411.1 phage antirepressor protein [Xylella fastidiosa]RWA34477.1 phage antirepressor protein [Xylella fastidiosa subsp. fastidiosa]WDF00357.1 phage antirepressor protein [Xylella fastidiosa subsp. fastidiosa]